MKKIKFRAWLQKPKMMVYEMEQDNDLGDIIKDHNYENGNYILMQYTGLKDKNGEEIYEGDIVKIDDDYELYGFFAGESYQIYFKNGAFRLKPKYKSEKTKGCCIDDAEGMTIVGNIYDNPDLIKE